MTRIKSDPRVYSKIKVKAPVKKVRARKVRARKDDGSFVADDPNTPENEAWVEKTESK